MPTPRLTAWMGDHAYRYSGLANEPQPWPPTLATLRDRLSEELGIAFNSCLANLYRDGSDSMGYHADDEPELGPQPVIASISLGARRRFALRHRHLQASGGPGSWARETCWSCPGNRSATTGTRSRRPPGPWVRG